MNSIDPAVGIYNLRFPSLSSTEKESHFPEADFADVTTRPSNSHSHRIGMFFFPGTQLSSGILSDLASRKEEDLQSTNPHDRQTSITLPTLRLL
jgi:hypothetical protein